MQVVTENMTKYMALEKMQYEVPASITASKNHFSVPYWDELLKYINTFHTQTTMRYEKMVGQINSRGA